MRECRREIIAVVLPAHPWSWRVVVHSVFLPALLVLCPGCGAESNPGDAPALIPKRDVTMNASDRYLLVTHVNGKAADGSAIEAGVEIRFSGGFRLPPEYKSPFPLMVTISRGKSILAETVLRPEQMQCISPGEFSHGGTISGNAWPAGGASLRVKHGINTYGETNVQLK